MRKCGLCCRLVSVHPSMLVDCIHMAKDIVKLLVQPGSPIILVFRLHAPIPSSEENPSVAMQKIHRGSENFAIFD